MAETCSTVVRHTAAAEAAAPARCPRCFQVADVWQLGNACPSVAHSAVGRIVHQFVDAATLVAL